MPKMMDKQKEGKWDRMIRNSSDSGAKSSVDIKKT